MYQLLLILFLLVYRCHSFLFGSSQSLCVKGKLTCFGQETLHAFVRIELWDTDSLRSDDLMRDGMTDEDGFFDICGTASDWIGDIDPLLEIYTYCGDEALLGTICERVIQVRIPSKYIGGTYEMEEFDLNHPLARETGKCKYPEFNMHTAPFIHAKRKPQKLPVPSTLQ